MTDRASTAITGFASRGGKLAGRTGRALRRLLSFDSKRLSYTLRVIAEMEGVHRRTCPLCGTTAFFAAAGLPPRYDAECPSCGSLERHRLFALADRQRGLIQPTHAVLHFAPEPCLERLLRPRSGHYVTADISDVGVDRRENIEALSLPDASVDRIVCMHVLEHVDDRKALAELFRVLRPGGMLIAAFPIIDAWADTYENPSVTDPSARILHFGQNDHVRFYGSDVVDRMRTVGFAVERHVATCPDAVTFGLVFGETLFLASKPA